MDLSLIPLKRQISNENLQIGNFGILVKPDGVHLPPMIHALASASDVNDLDGFLSLVETFPDSFRRRLAWGIDRVEEARVKFVKQLRLVFPDYDWDKREQFRPPQRAFGARSPSST